LGHAEIKCLMQGLQLVAPFKQRINRLIDLLEQIRDGGRQGTRGPGANLA
jgi:hypothetical protein